MSELKHSEIPLVSVVVPVYNMLPYLRRCVDSLLKQTLQQIEIILVDDGSSDGSGDLCEQLGKLDARIKVIHKANGGLSSARNAGIDVARGDFLSFVDSDDFLAPEALELLYQTSIQNDHAIVCMGSIILDSHLQEIKRNCSESRKVRLISPSDYIDGICRKKLSESVCDKLFPASIFKNIRFENGRLNEDFFCLSQILLRGISVVALDFSGYYYVKHGGTITSSRGNFLSLQDAVKNSYELLGLAQKKGEQIRCSFAYSVLFQAKVFLTVIPMRNILQKTDNVKIILDCLNRTWSYVDKVNLKILDRYFLMGMKYCPFCSKLIMTIVQYFLKVLRS